MHPTFLPHHASLPLPHTLISLPGMPAYSSLVKLLLLILQYLAQIAPSGSLP